MSRLPHKFHIAAMMAGCLLAGCQAAGPYQNRDKWLLTYQETRMVLRARPRQVTQYIYDARDTIKPELRKQYYIRYTFNREGLMTSRRDYMKDNLMVTTDWWVDDNGEQDSVKSIVDGKVIRKVSRRLSDGRYLTITAHVVGKSTASITRVVPGGDETITEYYADSTMRDQPTIVGHTYYSGNRLVRVFARTRRGSEDAHYFYSSWDAPDSLLTYDSTSAGKILRERQLFFHNDHGDVAREIVIHGKDTTRLEDDTYTYDAKGNWIRRVMISEIGETNPFGTGPSVMDREIVY